MICLIDGHKDAAMSDFRLPSFARADLVHILDLARDAHLAMLFLPVQEDRKEQDRVSIARKNLAEIALKAQKILAEDEALNKKIPA
jgi:hypothetical protein